MFQQVIIASAMLVQASANARLMLAAESTTALNVTMQSDVTAICLAAQVVSAVALVDKQAPAALGS